MQSSQTMLCRNAMQRCVQSALGAEVELLEKTSEQQRELDEAKEQLAVLRKKELHRPSREHTQLFRRSTVRFSSITRSCSLQLGSAALMCLGWAWDGLGHLWLAQAEG